MRRLRLACAVLGVPTTLHYALTVSLRCQTLYYATMLSMRMDAQLLNALSHFSVVCDRIYIRASEATAMCIAVLRSTAT
jgi:hypothetical protein